MALPLSSASVRALPFVLGAALFVSACSSSSDETGGDGGGTLASVVQNLTVDPDGQTVTIDVAGAQGVVTSASIEASGGQSAISVVRTGSSVAVEFDDRVTPEHQVRILGVAGVAESWRNVTSSDTRIPQISVISATQDTSDNLLGGDTIQLAFYSGPRVVESQVLDLDNWTVTVGGLDLDLLGSQVDFDTQAQIVELTLGTLANLHSSFSISIDADSVAAVAVNPAAVNGLATGDTVPPALEGGAPVTQNIVPGAAGDEFGRVVEFDFSEPISPVFGAQPSNFSVVDHGAAVGMTSITRVSVVPSDPSIVRVQFSQPVVPGLDQIAVDGLVDAHGNAFPAQTVPFTAGSTVANSFESVDFITQEGLDNDVVVAVMTQALDPDTAGLTDRWTLDVGGIGAVDLSTQEVSYDLLTKTLRVDLDFDVTNGTTADLSAVGAVDIDGEGFTLAAAQVLAAGDASAPTVEGLTQNRTVDDSGQTVDVQFSEAVDVMTATNTANYTFTPAITVNGAMVVDETMVRLELAEVAVPGDVTLTVAQAVSDPAGNDLGSVFGPGALTSTDTIAPAPIVAAARAIEGHDNDTVTVLFNDQLIQSEVENIASWTFESPVGQAVDLTQATVTYDPVVRVATLVLAGPNGYSLLGTDDFQVAVSAMRDLGGNDVDIAPIGGAITSESQRPALESVFAVAGGGGLQFRLRFSEPMRNLEDLFDATTNPSGVRYSQVNASTSVEEFATSALSLDGGLGVQIEFNAAIDPNGSINVIGLQDLAGNLLFPVLALPIAPEQVAAPAQGGTPSLDAVSGIGNDSITVQFATPMSGWRLLEPSQYTLTDTTNGVQVDLSLAKITRQAADTVRVDFVGTALAELGASSTYELQLNVDPNDPLRTEQGIPISAPDVASGLSVSGDVTQGPSGAGSRALVDPMNPNAAIVVFSETVDMLAALDATGYAFNGSVALSIAEYSPRAVQATFSVPVTIGGTLEIQSTAAVDSAGNPAGGLMTLAVTSDTNAPVLVSTAATASPGFGGDTVLLTFDEELDAALASDRFNYTVMAGSQVLRIANAQYSSNDFTVTLVCEDLDDGATIDVTVDGVADISGNVPGTSLTDSALATGDSVPPSILSAYVNLGANGSGLVVDVLFSESIDPDFADAIYRWSGSGGQSVTAAESLGTDHVQLLLDFPLGASDTLSLSAGLSDPAGNAAGVLTVDPTE